MKAAYSSPLRRAMQTAQAVAELQGLTVQSLAGIVDIDYGLWQGLSPDQVAEPPDPLVPGRPP